ncbi:MAG: hypothetical protein K2L45_00945 [Muribaculaceae bacterium]|nr:hypothetical protein [Muribaculaceae bacterium]
MISLKEKKTELSLLYSQLVRETEEYRLNDKNKDKGYVLFGAVAGRNYRRNGLMIIGRATNGWHRYVDSVNDLFSGKDKIFDYPEKLTELKNNNKKSRYWQVLSRIGENLFGENWEQSILYSNYCKIAPDEESDPNGTPKRKLRNLQDETCKRILNIELDIFSPKHIVAFTGCYAGDMDFSERLMSGLLSYLLSDDYSDKTWPLPIDSISWGNGKYVLEVYKIEDTYIYLSEHPDRKPCEEHSDVLIKTLRLYYLCSLKNPNYTPTSR